MILFKTSGTGNVLVIVISIPTVYKVQEEKRQGDLIFDAGYPELHRKVLLANAA